MRQKILNDLIKYCTARIEIRNVGNANNIIIKKLSDSNAKIDLSSKFNINDGVVKIIRSSEGFLDFELKCVNSGLLHIWLKSLNFKDVNGTNFPIYIDYVDFKVNNEKILKKNQVVYGENAYLFKKDVQNNEVLKIHIEWTPFNTSSTYLQDNICEKYQKQINSLNDLILFKDKQLNSVPQFSCISLGYGGFNNKVVYRNWNSLMAHRNIRADLNGFCEDLWFTKYLKHKFPNEDFKINIFGVSNPHYNLTYPMEGKKVLFSAEDLNYRYLEMKLHFDKFALNHVDLALSYDLIDNPKYLRFPYWLITHFSPEVTAEEIEKKVDMWNSINYEKSKDVVAIASHDDYGTRTIIANDINSYTNITYGGKWRNNTSDLWNKYNNNKEMFLNSFKFNLCAENLINDGYVTEKIFDAFTSDCIPLYAGGGDYFEPKVVNPKAVIRWFADEKLSYDPKILERAYLGRICHSNVKWVVEDDRNLDTIELFKNLLSDKKTYDEFKDQDKVLNSSKKYLINKFSKLEKHFERLIFD